MYMFRPSGTMTPKGGPRKSPKFMKKVPELTMTEGLLTVSTFQE